MVFRFLFSFDFCLSAQREPIRVRKSTDCKTVNDRGTSRNQTAGQTRCHPESNSKLVTWAWYENIKKPNSTHHMPPQIKRPMGLCGKPDGAFNSPPSRPLIAFIPSAWMYRLMPVRRAEVSCLCRQTRWSLWAQRGKWVIWKDHTDLVILVLGKNETSYNFYKQKKDWKYIYRNVNHNVNMWDYRWFLSFVFFHIYSKILPLKCISLIIKEQEFYSIKREILVLLEFSCLKGIIYKESYFG